MEATKTANAKRVVLVVDDDRTVNVFGSASEVFLLKLTRAIKAGGYDVVMSATVAKGYELGKRPPRRRRAAGRVGDAGRRGGTILRFPGVGRRAVAR